MAGKFKKHMDMLDQALDSNSQDKTNESTTSDDTAHMQTEDGSVEESVDEQGSVIASGAADLLSSGVQYPFRAENGALTFRVVQVAQGPDSEGAQVLTSTYSGQQGVPVIGSPFSNGSSPTADGQTAETRFTYFPAVATTAEVGADGTSTAALAATPTGQFYVMMSSQDVIAGSPRSIAPRSHQYTSKVDGTRTVRDERRRATHNEVERRRRDKINNWIVKLSKIVPDCSQDHTKQGQLSAMASQSKGGILAKTCDYIHELRSSNIKMAESLKDTEQILSEADSLRRQYEELKAENVMLRNQLQQNGIIITNLSST